MPQIYEYLDNLDISPLQIKVHPPGQRAKKRDVRSTYDDFSVIWPIDKAWVKQKAWENRWALGNTSYHLGLSKEKKILEFNYRVAQRRKQALRAEAIFEALVDVLPHNLIEIIISKAGLYNPRIPPRIIVRKSTKDTLW